MACQDESILHTLQANRIFIALADTQAIHTHVSVLGTLLAYTTEYTSFFKHTH